MNRFRLFVETFVDRFGFDEIEARKEKELKPEEEDDLPIKSFNVQWMMDVLARKKIGNRIKSSSAFLNEVIWGEPKKPGAIRVRLTPNIEVYIERCITDLEGAPTWLAKKLFMPKLKEFAGREEIVAKDVFEEVEVLYKEKLDNTSEEYKDLIILAKRMGARIRTHAPLIYDYQDIKEVNKDYYIIYFSIRNAGVGKLVSRTSQLALSPEVTIDVNFNKEKGLLHVIMATVSIGSKGQGWEVDLPYLDSWFAPSQSRDEIIDVVLTSLKYY